MWGSRALPLLRAAATLRRERTPRPVIVTLVAVLAAGSLSGASVPTATADDAIPPNTGILVFPSPTGHTVGPSFKVWGVETAGSAGLAGARCRLDAQPWVECGTSPGYQFTGVAGGAHTITAVAYDVDGLEDPTPATDSITVDAAGPVTSAVTINDGAATAGRLTWRVAVTATDPAGLKDVVFSAVAPPAGATGLPGIVGNVVSGANLITLRYNLLPGATTDPGRKTIWLQVNDKYGNRGPIRSASIVYDPTQTVGVQWQIDPGRNPAPVDSTVYLRGRLVATDGTAVKDGTVTFSVDGHPEWSSTDLLPASANNAGKIGFFQPMAPGIYHATFAFLGGDGVHAGSASFDVQVGPDDDPRPPDTFIGGLVPPTPEQPAYGLESLRGTTFECSIDDGSWAACGPTWTLDPLSDGLHVLEARAISMAGVKDPTPAVVVVAIPLVSETAYISVPETTGQAVVTLGTHANITDADRFRVSGSHELGPDGALADGVDTDLPEGAVDGSLRWDFTDEAHGGVPGDGPKVVFAQWHRTDGSWTKPIGAQTMLDTTPPSVSIVVDNGVQFVDEDRLLVQEDADETASFSGSTLPKGAIGWGGTIFDDSDIVTAPIVPVADGAVEQRTVTVVARDRMGNAGSASATITIDRSRPTATVNAPTMTVGTRISTTRLPLHLGGTTHDTGIGVSQSMLDTSTTPDVWDPIASTSSTKVAALVSAPMGSPLAWRVRGEDGLGHVGSGTNGVTVHPVLYGDASSHIAYRGWTSASRSGAFGDKVHRAKKDGSKATLSFNGRAFAIVAPRGARLGRIAVLVDGKRIATVDLHASTTTERTLVYVKSWSAKGKHTVTLKADVSSAGPTVALDGIVVLQ